MMDLQTLLLRIPPILFALTIHEYAHGLVADRLGDPTARYAGRLTFNPLSHLDPIGTLMLLLVGFGWARPVPVDPRNLRNPKRDMMWISLAGPGANVLLAAILGLILRGVGASSTVWYMVWFGMSISLVLAVFNLIPIPPLDGSKILMGLLPPRLEYGYRRTERYGRLILMGLILSSHILPFSILGGIILPPVRLLSKLFAG